jgi:hypothetical protein
MKECDLRAYCLLKIIPIPSTESVGPFSRCHGGEVEKGTNDISLSKPPTEKLLHDLIRYITTIAFSSFMEAEKSQETQICPSA